MNNRKVEVVGMPTFFLDRHQPGLDPERTQAVPLFPCSQLKPCGCSPASPSVPSPLLGKAEGLPAEGRTIAGRLPCGWPPSSTRGWTFQGEWRSGKGRGIGRRHCEGDRKRSSVGLRDLRVWKAMGRIRTRWLPRLGREA